jgi:hypothetical protein
MTVSIHRKIGKETFFLEGTYKGKPEPLSNLWQKMQDLKKKGHVVKYEEKIQAIGKRKPITVTLIWVKK